MQVQDDTAANNGGSGIYIGQVGSHQAVVGNLDLTQKLGNIVSNNAGDGVYAFGNVLVAGNVISGSTSAGMAGIYLYYAGEVANNVVFNNNNGILTFIANSPIHGNRVYHNLNAGISTDRQFPLVQQCDL